ncbi:hypothetical protein IP88_14090 [alpha proteobacterium AAP81b]|nr:hypothetical protein IP88_14090 [alpha proteobacterium AAP81b]
MLDTLGRPAKLRYLSGSYHVVQPGAFVTCAVTAKRIALPALRYWSHELQEAYADAAAANRRYREMKAKGLL